MCREKCLIKECKGIVFNKRMCREKCLIKEFVGKSV